MVSTADGEVKSVKPLNPSSLALNPKATSYLIFSVKVPRYVPEVASALAGLGGSQLSPGPCLHRTAGGELDAQERVPLRAPHCAVTPARAAPSSAPAHPLVDLVSAHTTFPALLHKHHLLLDCQDSSWSAPQCVRLFYFQAVPMQCPLPEVKRGSVVSRPAMSLRAPSPATSAPEKRQSAEKAPVCSSWMGPRFPLTRRDSPTCPTSS